MSEKPCLCPFCGKELKMDMFRGITNFLCEGCGAIISFRGAEKRDAAIKAIHRRAQPANEPLTLEQLREMDGEPVWCVDCFGNQCWALANVADDDCIDKETGAWNMGLYGVSDKPVDLTGWLAYRRKPERSENDGNV